MGLWNLSLSQQKHDLETFVKQINIVLENGSFFFVNK